MNAIKDNRETAVLAKYSTTLLLAAVLDRSMDCDQLKVEQLEDAIEIIEKRNVWAIKERAILRAKLERENNQKKGIK